MLMQRETGALISCSKLLMAKSQSRGWRDRNGIIAAGLRVVAPQSSLVVSKNLQAKNIVQRVEEDRLETFGKVVLMSEECDGCVRQWLIVARNKASKSVDDIPHLLHTVESRTSAKARQDSWVQRLEAAITNLQEEEYFLRTYYKVSNSYVLII
jgi:hypothetical protein